MQATESIRKRGFSAYLGSLVCFMLELVLVATEQMEISLRYPFAVALSVIVAFMLKDLKVIVDAASPIFCDGDDWD